ncbi:MAG: hypothetical protein KJ578_14100 [Bacteroidetes bacterium]|nr:hypothetical protein [Bacteroidota bacterium]MBU1579738.1 hypothetical protein [Bacteroidota bacterium]MBU2558906.1 hypothetical protein [Bacteroidota bacterium]
MMAKPNILIYLSLILVLSFVPGIMNAQYFRDQTRLLFYDSLYPTNEKAISKGYATDELVSISLHPEFGIPEINVIFGSFQTPLFFDFGNNGNILITNAISDSVPFIIQDTIPTYTPDGQVRAIVYSIVLPEFQLLDSLFHFEPSTLADWSVFSTSPTNGIVGLKYFQQKRFTLSYRSRLLGISNTPLPDGLISERASIFPIQVFDNHPYGVYFEAEVAGQDVLVYFDTGKSHSQINLDLVDPSQIVSDKSGRFYADTIAIQFENHRFEMVYPRVGTINRSTNSSLPVGMEVGSDLLQHFLLTIDRTDGKNQLILH